MSDVPLNTTLARVWDLNDPSGPAQYQLQTVAAREWLARDPSRYVLTLPPGTNAGPKSGMNRIIIDGYVGL